MPRGEQVGRLYALVMDLARSKHGLTVAALARRRDVRVRTVYRDLHALEAAGFPIASADGARWKLIDGWEARIPFPLPLGQLLALHVARDLIRPIGGTPVAREFDALYERLVGPVRSGETAQGELFPRFRTVLKTRSQLAIDYERQAALLETLCRACEARLTVRAVYYSESRRAVTQRGIDPYCLYFDPQLEALYVFGWCHLRRAIRTFAVHRFRQVTTTERGFQVPATFAPERYLRGAFRIWRGENTVTVRIRVDAEAAGWVSERRWHASQKVRRRADGSCELAFTADGDRELRRFVLQLGAAAEVVEPEWFRREIAEEQLRAARRNQRGPRKRLTLDDTAAGDRRGRGS
jgi:predicted DNA-binding transcriptional regulator YafY